MKIEVLIVIFAAAQAVMAQSGGGETITFGGRVRLPSETFIPAFNDPASAEYISFKDAFEDQLNDEVSAELTNRGISFSSASVEVRSLSEGSVIVNFILTIEGTTINANNILDILETVSADSTIGSLSVEQIQDLNECTENSDTCSEFADCVNNVGSFTCDCTQQYYDQSGDGTICVTPVSVLCEATSMKITVTKNYLDNLGVSLGNLRLRDEACGGSLNSTSDEYEFEILNDLSGCSGVRSTNDTHVTYENTLSNEPKADAVIVTGTNVSIPFSCSYPNNVNTTFSFEGQVDSVNVDTSPGTNDFDINLELFTTDQYSTRESNTVFQTTDTLYFQAGLTTQDSSLTMIMNRCWATPTEDGNDATQYNIITDGCEVSSAVSGTVNVITNGETSESRFSAQVFTFIDETTTYIHCSLEVCSTANGNVCQPTCAGSRRRKREAVKYSTVTLSRKRRQSDPDNVDKTYGPLYRATADVVVDTRFWAVTMCLVAFVLVLLTIIGFLVRKVQIGREAAVIALKLKHLAGQENPGYA